MTTRGDIRSIGTEVKKNASLLNQTHIDWRARKQCAIEAKRLLTIYIKQIERAHNENDDMGRD